MKYHFIKLMTGQKITNQTEIERYIEKLAQHKSVEDIKRLLQFVHISPEIIHEKPTPIVGHHFFPLPIWVWGEARMGQDHLIPAPDIKIFMGDEDYALGEKLPLHEYWFSIPTPVDGEEILIMVTMPIITQDDLPDNLAQIELRIQGEAYSNVEKLKLYEKRRLLKQEVKTFIVSYLEKNYS